MSGELMQWSLRRESLQNDKGLLVLPRQEERPAVMIIKSSLRVGWEMARAHVQAQEEPCPTNLEKKQGSKRKGIFSNLNRRFDVVVFFHSIKGDDYS